MTEHLLEVLKGRANVRGLVLVPSAALEKTLACSFPELSAALQELSDAGELEVLSPAPYLTIALLPREWSGSSGHRMQKEQQISNPPPRMQKKVPVSSSAAAAATQSREVGGSGEGGMLLEEVLAALGPEAARAEFTAILDGRSPALIHRALKRVQSTPRIRVSKAALFRSLLEKFSQ